MYPAQDMYAEYRKNAYKSIQEEHTAKFRSGLLFTKRTSSWSAGPPVATGKIKKWCAYQLTYRGGKI